MFQILGIYFHPVRTGGGISQEPSITAEIATHAESFISLMWIEEVIPTGVLHHRWIKQNPHHPIRWSPTRLSLPFGVELWEQLWQLFLSILQHPEKFSFSSMRVNPCCLRNDRTTAHSPVGGSRNAISVGEWSAGGQANLQTVGMILREHISPTTGRSSIVVELTLIPDIWLLNDLNEFYSGDDEGWHPIQINHKPPIIGTNKINIHCHWRPVSRMRLTFIAIPGQMAAKVKI